jgi:hypothetical protein
LWAEKKPAGSAFNGLTERLRWLYVLRRYLAVLDKKKNGAAGEGRHRSRAETEDKNIYFPCLKKYLQFIVCLL